MGWPAGCSAPLRGGVVQRMRILPGSDRAREWQAAQRWAYRSEAFGVDGGTQVWFAMVSGDMGFSKLLAGSRFTLPESWRFDTSPFGAWSGWACLAQADR